MAASSASGHRERLAGCIPQFFSAAGRIDPANAGLSMARVTSAGYVGSSRDLRSSES